MYVYILYIYIYIIFLTYTQPYIYSTAIYPRSRVSVWSLLATDIFPSDKCSDIAKQGAVFCRLERQILPEMIINSSFIYCIINNVAAILSGEPHSCSSTTTPGWKDPEAAYRASSICGRTLELGPQGRAREAPERAGCSIFDRDIWGYMEPQHPMRIRYPQECVRSCIYNATSAALAVYVRSGILGRFLIWSPS